MAIEAAPWLVALRRFAIASVLGHFVWETLQIPLYTIWHVGTAAQIAFAVVHCTGGDMLIAGATLLGSLFVLGRNWPSERAAYRGVAIATIVLGLAYTALSEWLNVNVREAWAYSPWMPRLPPLGTGLSPLLQWIVVPLAAFAWARPRLRAVGSIS